METGDDGESELAYVSLGGRFVAQLIDNIVLAVLLLPAIFLSDTAAGIWFIVWFIVWVFYTFILEGIGSRQTVGKYMGGYRVAKKNGSPIKIRHSILRNLVGVFGQFFGWVGYIVGAFAIHQSDENQRIGDNIAGTVVVKVRD